MHVLGLNIGHNATAALLEDGKVVACVSEERFSRLKNHYGVPFQSIHYLLEHAQLTMQNIGLVVVDDHYPVTGKKDFTKEFMEAYTNKPIHKRVFSYLGYSFPQAFQVYQQVKESLSTRKERMKQAITCKLAQALHISPLKIALIDHHAAHAFSPCFNLPRNKKTLVFTLDGEGSGTCATVNVYDGKNLTVLARTKKVASLGYLYALATLFLGMKPLEHEFKVMGLAPYAKEHKVAALYPKLSNLIHVDDTLTFNATFSTQFADHFFKKELRFVRFDIIAGALQKLVEERTVEWITKAIKKTGITDIALSGGVFMNVKANQKIAELSEVESLFIMPSCGDEASAFGAALYGYKLLCKKQGIPFTPQPFTDLYLGPAYSDDYIEGLIVRKDLAKMYRIKKLKDPAHTIAKLLAQGEIIARCSGRSEWGARALGNRSILANPVHPDTIRILNETIKDRDFWMPFTPSILDTHAKKYFRNKKKIATPYMIITFNATAAAKKELPAAIHPYDFTLRPQVVSKEHNPEYYAILKQFSRLTGTGALLNTSFNLHGEPNVLTPEDALHTVENSSLRYLLLGSYLFEKKQRNAEERAYE